MNESLNLSKDQTIMSIRSDGRVAYIETKDGKIVTNGFVGENEYENFIELIKGLQGFDIKIDQFYW